MDDGEAEGLVRDDLFCVAPIAGGERRAARASRPWRQREHRERGRTQGREQVGEGEGSAVRGHGLGASLTTLGSEARRRGAAAGRYGAAAWLQEGDDAGFTENPLPLSSFSDFSVLT